MKSLAQLIQQKKQLRVVGFDDAPFQKEQDSQVSLSGIVCANTRFEGMLWGEVTRDGTDATDTLVNMLLPSKFFAQTHLVITDGLAFGGFNLLDLPQLSERLSRPVIAVMRRRPDLEAIDRALNLFSDAATRKALVAKAGEIHEMEGFTFQVAGCDAEEAGLALKQLTDTGKVPEALRLAHLIGSAVKTGQSSNRA